MLVENGPTCNITTTLCLTTLYCRQMTTQTSYTITRRSSGIRLQDWPRHCAREVPAQNTKFKCRLHHKYRHLSTCKKGTSTHNQVDSYQSIKAEYLGMESPIFKSKRYLERRRLHLCIRDTNKRSFKELV